MSFFKKKVWIIFLIILIAAVALAYASRNGGNKLSDAVNFVMTPVQSKLAYLTKSVDDFFSFVGNMKQYEKENQELKIENEKLLAKIKDISEYTEENERLKKLLGISYEMSEYETVAARVVAFDTDNWFSGITIDKGEKDGIKVSDTVIAAEGIVGQVSEVGYNWAKISTIINPESSAGVRIVRNGEIGISEGDVKLSKTNKCKLAYLAANASVIAGDILETSGLGGIYPPGLMVGKIAEVRKDSMGRLDYAVIEPFIDFDNLYEAIVITKWDFESNDYGDDYYIPSQEPDAQDTTTESLPDEAVNNGISVG